jgi:hypothetical protein
VLELVLECNLLLSPEKTGKKHHLSAQPHNCWHPRPIAYGLQSFLEESLGRSTVTQANPLDSMD